MEFGTSSSISKDFEKSGFSQKISEDISDSQSANDDNSLSNIQNLINWLPFDDKPVNAELFTNFDSDISTCKTFIDQESLKQEICDMFENENYYEKDCVIEDEID